MLTNMNMNTQEALSPADMLDLATSVASAYLSNNAVAVSEIPVVLDQAFQAIAKLCATGLANTNRPDPAVPVNQSIYDDYIICLEDGKRLKMLKRHLKSSYNMTPEQYRERWSLPLDYPMVAPNYAKKRSALAMQIGLGRKRKVQVAA
jgi:predicted transcriptional regulator